MTRFRTSAAYLSGGICGHIWWPYGHLCGKTIKKDARGPWGFMDCFSDPNGTTFREALDSLLTREGGDFQDPRFTAETTLRVERRRQTERGYEFHIWEREISELPDCADLVDQGHYVTDFLGEFDE